MLPAPEGHRPSCAQSPDPPALRPSGQVCGRRPAASASALSFLRRGCHVVFGSEVVSCPRCFSFLGRGVAATNGFDDAQSHQATQRATATARPRMASGWPCCPLVCREPSTWPSWEWGLRAEDGPTRAPPGRVGSRAAGGKSLRPTAQNSGHSVPRGHRDLTPRPRSRLGTLRPLLQARPRLPVVPAGLGGVGWWPCHPALCSLHVASLRVSSVGREVLGSGPTVTPANLVLTGVRPQRPPLQ